MLGFALSFSPSLLVYALVMAADVITITCVFSPLASLIPDLVPKEQSGRASGIQQILLTLGGLGACIMGYFNAEIGTIARNVLPLPLIWSQQLPSCFTLISSRCSSWFRESRFSSSLWRKCRWNDNRKQRKSHWLSSSRDSCKLWSHSGIAILFCYASSYRYLKDSLTPSPPNSTRYACMWGLLKG